MTQEIIYTSAKKGLRLGSRGFCTVASTPGMAKGLAERLESLSGYKHIFQPGDPKSHLNPINYSHVNIRIGGLQYYVLSRIADAGLDYTQRTNKIAHHIALEPRERVPGGPAWLLAEPGFMVTEWTGEPRLFRKGRAIPVAEPQPGICTAWRELTGDAGWGGVLAQAIQHGTGHAFLIFKPGMDLLPLIAESLAILPSEQRWKVTFSTYFTQLPHGIECLWRCVLDETSEARSALRSETATVINLATPLGQAPDGPLVPVARTGVLPEAPISKPLSRRIKTQTDIVEDTRPTVLSTTATTDANITALPPVRSPASRQGSESTSSQRPQRTGEGISFNKRRLGRRKLISAVVVMLALLFGAGIGVGGYAVVSLLWDKDSNTINIKKEYASEAKPKTNDQVEQVLKVQGKAQDNEKCNSVNNSSGEESTDRNNLTYQEESEVPNNDTSSNPQEDPIEQEKSNIPVSERINSVNNNSTEELCKEPSLVNLKKYVDLLYVPMSRASGDISWKEPVKLGELTNIKGKDLCLDITGNPLLKIIRDIDEQDSWLIYYDNPNLDEFLLAEVYLENSSLSFHFLDKAQEKAKAANLIRQCFLRVRYRPDNEIESRLARVIALSPIINEYPKRLESDKYDHSFPIKVLLHDRKNLAINYRIDKLPNVLDSDKHLLKGDIQFNEKREIHFGPEGVLICRLENIDETNDEIRTNVRFRIKGDNDIPTKIYVYIDNKINRINNNIKFADRMMIYENTNMYPTEEEKREANALLKEVRKRHPSVKLWSEVKSVLEKELSIIEDKYPAYEEQKKICLMIYLKCLIFTSE